VSEVFVLQRFDFLDFDPLKPSNGAVILPAYTDLMLHTIADGPTDPIAEPLDQNQPAGSLASLLET
jgi:hypothetical protein